jgi:SagB-type dehydrogenase family enzyme
MRRRFKKMTNMKVTGFILVFALLSMMTIFANTMQEEKIMLPSPSKEGKISIEEAIVNRRTVRSFKPDPIAVSDLSQFLWAAQGITDTRRGLRSAPSGGALYPLDVYVVIGKKGVKGLAEGVYRYLPESHSIEKLAESDRRGELARAALGQNWMTQAPVIFVITAEYKRINKKYGNRGIRYALIEVGHVGQNIFLQAESLGLGAGIVGAFNDQEVAKVISALPGHEPLSIMPIGYKK